MFKKIAMAALFAATLCPVASFAQVHITVAPPAPVVEVRGNPPDRGYVWVDGYHRYDGGHYAVSYTHLDVYKRQS